MRETSTPYDQGDPVDAGRAIDEQAVCLTRGLRSNLDYAHKLYGKTRNPLYAIYAIHLVSHPGLAPTRGVDPAYAIPEWCLDWLHTALSNVLVIARSVRRRGKTVAAETRDNRILTPRQATQRVPRALGLTRRGKNAFRDFGADAADVDLADLLYFLQVVLTPDGKRPKKLEDLKPELGTVREDSVVRRRVKRGKQLRRE